ncbi:hypothetical protein HPP92_000973 [Vanilla planifolia]|uniref:Sey1/RHD3-like three-helix bundle domain-containing protein n=1 Tax=Vanilla planifolia TaxID=51239 RepID=A0A835VEX5_VANPL|nr:hypothetical protein HPP92_000973 [Vanilla planifolia]
MIRRLYILMMALERQKRQQLESRVLQLVHPAFVAMLGHLRSKALDKFKTELEESLNGGRGFAASVRDSTQSSLLQFDQECSDVAIKQADWDESRVREKLIRDIEAHATSIRSIKLSDLITYYEKQITEELSEPVESLFDTSGRDTWASIRKLYNQVADKAVSGLSATLSGFEMDQVSSEKMEMNLKNHAKSVVEKKSREAAGKALISMKDRFSTVFSHDNDSMPRVWTGKEDIRKITKEARAAALKLLSVLVAMRLDEKPYRIDNILNSTLGDAPSAKERGIVASSDPLASSTWENVLPENTLISPVQCKALWKQFRTETEYTVSQAISAQEAHRRSNGMLPPPWAVIAIAVLGFNELMVSGLLSISSKLLPTIMNIIRRLAEAGHASPSSGSQQPSPQGPPPLGTQSLRNPSQRQVPVPNPTPEVSSSSSLVSSPRNHGDQTTQPTKKHIDEADSESSTS